MERIWVGHGCSRHLHTLQGSELWEKRNSAFEFARCSVIMITTFSVGRTDRGWSIDRWSMHDLATYSSQPEIITITISSDFTDFSGRPLVQTGRHHPRTRAHPAFSCPHTDFCRIRPPLRLCKSSTGDQNVGSESGWLVAAGGSQNRTSSDFSPLELLWALMTILFQLYTTPSLKALTRSERRMKIVWVLSQSDKGS